MNEEQRTHIEQTIAALARMLQQIELLIEVEDPSPEALMALSGLTTQWRNGR